jgi:hypothetical protein
MPVEHVLNMLSNLMVLVCVLMVTHLLLKELANGSHYLSVWFALKGVYAASKKVVILVKVLHYEMWHLIRLLINIVAHVYMALLLVMRKTIVIVRDLWIQITLHNVYVPTRTIWIVLVNVHANPIINMISSTKISSPMIAMYVQRDVHAIFWVALSAIPMCYAMSTQ